jgi:uncharacterized membrane protein YebE (DUF533 family)
MRCEHSVGVCASANGEVCNEIQHPTDTDRIVAAIREAGELQAAASLAARLYGLYEPAELFAEVQSVMSRLRSTLRKGGDDAR